MPSFEEGPSSTINSISDTLQENRWPVAGILVGFIVLGVGVFLYKGGYFEDTSKIEVIYPEVSAEDSVEKEIVVEVAGAVVKPGVYKLKDGSRIEDLLIMAGGVSADADREWFGKFINRAAKVSDGQKIYIYKSGEISTNPLTEIQGKQSDSGSAKNNDNINLYQGSVAGASSGTININTATLSELDKLPGIGHVYGQSIIDHRPYSDLSELVSKGAIKENVFEKIKNQISVY